MWDNEHSLGNHELCEANMGIAEYLTSRGRYREAETLTTYVLAVREKLLGPKHPDTLKTIQNLAIVYHKLG